MAICCVPKMICSSDHMGRAASMRVMPKSGYEHITKSGHFASCVLSELVQYAPSWLYWRTFAVPNVSPPPQVTDSINSLVNVCTSAAPGQRECDNAIRQIQSLQPLLANPTEPISDCSYFECLETVMDKSRSLGTLHTSTRAYSTALSSSR